MDALKLEFADLLLERGNLMLEKFQKDERIKGIDLRVNEIVEQIRVVQTA